jgi:tetratricopeptide (TPR) repeat protein
MHALMSDFLVGCAGGRADRHWSRACQALLDVMEPRLLQDPQAWPLMSLCEPHAAHLFLTGTHGGKPLENSPRSNDAIELGRRAADLLRSRGELEGSRKLLEALVGEAIKLLNSPLAEINAMYSYCRTLEELGRWDEVLEQLKTLFFMGQHTVGHHHPLVLAAKRLQARVLAAKGDMNGAHRMFNELLQTRKSFEQIGIEFPIEQVALNEELGSFLYRAKNYKQAVVFMRKVLAVYRARSGEESEETLRAKANLAQSLRSVGGAENLSLAKQLLSSVHEVTDRIYGPRHRRTIITKSNLSELLLQIGEVDEALRLKDEALDAATSSLGEDHPDTLFIRRSLAAIYLGKKKDAQNARRVLLDVLASERRLGDPDAEATLFLLRKLDEEGA